MSFFVISVLVNKVFHVNHPLGQWIDSDPERVSRESMTLHSSVNTCGFAIEVWL